MRDARQAGPIVDTAAVTSIARIIEFVPVFAPLPYAIGAAIVLASTVLAALLPALRAARIDPSRALRIE
jgi:ABC-type antimicrobial peptide transport system permease subunit